MRDQADKLRQLVGDFRGAPRPGPRPLMVLLAGGKGGDGTTTVALHLAMELRRQGGRVVLVEADPQGGHLALLCRLTEGPTLADVLSGRRHVSDVVYSGPGDILVLPGAWGLEGPLEPESVVSADWVDQFQELSPPPEVLVIDAGSGSSRILQRLWDEADTAIVVTATGAVSLMNAYALMKYLTGHGRTSLPIRCLANRVSGESESRLVQSRLAEVCREYLSLSMAEGGWLPDDPRLALHASWQSESPPHDPGLFVGLRQLAGKLLEEQSRRGVKEKRLEAGYPADTTQATLSLPPAQLPPAVSVSTLVENQTKEAFSSKQPTPDSTSNREQPIYGDTVG